MDLEFKRKEKVVGFFILTIAFLLLLSLVLIGRGKDWFKTYKEYYSVFEETYNLQKGAPVKLYNADIGKVKEIELVNDEVRVTLYIVEKFANRVKKTSYVTVKSPTFIGSEYIALAGTDKDSPEIEEGGKIPSIEKKSISDIMDEFQVEETAKKFVESVQNLSEMAEKLNSEEGPVFSVMYDIERIVDDIEKGEGNVGQILRTSVITDEISDRFNQIENILEDLRTAVSKTPYTMDLVNQNLERADRIGENIEISSQKINLMVDDLRKRINEVQLIIENIEKGSENVPRITKTTLDGIQEIREGVRKADEAVEALQKTFLIRNKLPERVGPEQYKPDARP